MYPLSRPRIEQLWKINELASQMFRDRVKEIQEHAAARPNTLLPLQLRALLIPLNFSCATFSKDSISASENKSAGDGIRCLLRPHVRGFTPINRGMVKRRYEI